VLLGLMTLEDARWWNASSASSSARTRFDRGFHPAVRAGFLTGEQARVRGDRVAYASRLIHKHGIDDETAFRVADNEQDLASAIARGPRPARAPASPTRRENTPSANTVYVLFALLVLAVAGTAVLVQAGRAARSHAPLANAARKNASGAASGLLNALDESTEIRTDAVGRTVRIEGPTPEVVLAAFCRTEPGLPQAVRTVIHDSEALGFFRRNGGAYLLPIRKAPDGRWSAGNGVDPVASLARAGER